MNTLEEKLQKGEKIVKIIQNIKSLESALDTLKDQLDIRIGNNTSGNLMRYKIFSDIMWKHIEEMKKDINESIENLEEELESLIK